MPKGRGSFPQKGIFDERQNTVNNEHAHSIRNPMGWDPGCGWWKGKLITCLPVLGWVIIFCAIGEAMMENRFFLVILRDPNTQTNEDSMTNDDGIDAVV